MSHPQRKRFTEEEARMKGGPDPSNASDETSLRDDLLYLRCILAHAASSHRSRTREDRLTETTLHDYLAWLTIDALQDEAHARGVAINLARLQEELDAQARHSRAQNRDPAPQAYYEGYLHALEQVLSHAHGEDLVLGDEISRRTFNESWEEARERLGL